MSQAVFNLTEFESVYIKAFPFWNVISKTERAYILDNSTAATYTKGYHIHDSDECSGVILVRSGCLRAYMISEDGKEVTLYRLYPGDMCMLSASCVLQSITFDVFVDAEEDSQCIVISGPAFAAVAERQPEVRIFSLETAVNRFSDVMWTMQQILFKGFDRRLAAFLISEYERTGLKQIKMTHEQIAQHTSSAREVVARMLKRFAADGLVEFKRGLITLKDTDALKKMI